MNNTLVSVIIPAYNHEKYIQYTIQSIINQTYNKIELIIIDDGSKDNTWEKINELKECCEKRFVNVHFETKENEGCAATLNKLINLCSGEYIYLIASDDISKPQAIEKEVEFLSENPEYALVVGDNEIIDSENRLCFWDKKRNIVYDKRKAKFYTFADFLQNKRFNFNSKKFGTYKTLYRSNYLPNGYLIRKSIFNKIKPFTPEAPLEDYFLMLQISKYAKMKFINEILFSYRWHTSNSIKNDEKIQNYTLKTRQYEDIIIKDINRDEIFPDVINTIKYGSCYNRFGIPFIFEIISCQRSTEKVKIFKLFNIKIAEKIPRTCYNK